MSHHICKAPIVRHYQKAFRVSVKPSNRIDSLLYALYKLRDTFSSHLVVHSSHKTARLIEHNIYLFTGLLLYAFSRNSHYIEFGIDLIPQIRHMSVYLHLAAGYKLFRFTPGSHSRLCKVFLQSDFFYRHLFHFLRQVLVIIVSNRKLKQLHIPVRNSTCATDSTASAGYSLSLYISSPSS